jgi:hypothetical protein
MTPHIDSALEKCLSRHFGVHRSIVELRRTRSPYRTSFPIEDIRLQFDDRTQLDLIFKNLNRNALGEAARLVKPAFVYNPLREIEAYDILLSPSGLGTAEFYGSVADARSNHYWLFLEKVPGVELFQVGDLKIWKEVARWLAVMHRRLALDSGLLTRLSHVLDYDRQFYRQWLQRARKFLAPSENMEWLARRYDRVIDRLVNMPRGPIHGEFYPSNLLVCQTTGTLRVCPVDWEMAALGPPLIDLAALTLGQWTDEERRAIVLAYRDGMETQGETFVPVDEFVDAIEYCRLHLCVQWLGWAPNWSPPSEHAHDWLAEAMLLAKKLDL